ncbi:type II secretion system protein [Alkalibacillus silvisoli]|uniref:Prepilin-type N-terminal cleavage/methylation domain-containing protein n=1 Tax=Alkalibacillus silvisoli TaxID=392823 RepID=A0ABN0ZKP6_9BACI
MKSHIKLMRSNQGFTLIEILGAITILSIVLISFIGFFSQSIILSSKVEDELTAINIAESVLSEIKDDPSEVESYNGRRIVENERNYYPFIEIYSGEELSKTENDLNLDQVIVQVYAETPNPSENNTPSAELFGYIEQED